MKPCQVLPCIVPCVVIHISKDKPFLDVVVAAVALVVLLVQLVEGLKKVALPPAAVLVEAQALDESLREALD